MQYLLSMNNISKYFPGVQALDKVDFELQSGTVHSLMGENGAGKSTLMKCLFGIYKKDEGEIYLDGEKVDFSNVSQALLGGVAMVQQELNQATKRSVMDNVWLGRYPLKFHFMIDDKKMYQMTKDVFKTLDIDVDPRETMSNLSVSQRQMVEIAKAVSYDARIIVFDEPTSSLTEVEIEHLFKIIQKLKENNCGIIYISHKMDEISRISDYITVMRDGKKISTNKATEISMNEVIKQMVGRELSNRFPPKINKPGKKVLEIKELSSLYNKRVNNVSFTLREREILGVAGLIGAGRTDILDLIYGVQTKDTGSIYLSDNLLKIKSSKQAIKHGFALLTEERRATGIFNVLNIQENTVIANINSYSKYGYLINSVMREDTKTMIDALKIKTPNEKTKIMSLSGGNQQKVILARWLLTKPQILLLDEPTRGIDVGAKYEIYQLMIELANSGKSIIMVSSELPELLGVCDRIMVISNGKVAGIVDAKKTNQEEIMELSWKYI